MAKGDNVELGYAGELAVAEVLRRRGWDVEAGPPGGPDLIVNEVVTIDVKTARLTERVDKQYKRWQFCLWRDDGDHQPFNEDLLILCCWSEKLYYFIVPGVVVHRNMKQLNITSADPTKYQGRWTEFGEAWELADYVIAGTLWMGNQNLR